MAGTNTRMGIDPQTGKIVYGTPKPMDEIAWMNPAQDVAPILMGGPALGDQDVTYPGPSQAKVPPEETQGKHGLLAQILLRLGSNLASGVGENVAAFTNPTAYREKQENMRQQAQLLQQLNMRNSLSAYERAQLAHQAQQDAQTKAQQDFENRVKLVSGISNGMLQPAAPEGTPLPGFQQQAAPSPAAPPPEGADMLSQLFALPQKQMAPTLTQAPKPYLSAGGLNVNPVPGATEKDLVEIDPSKFDPASSIGKGFLAAGLTKPFKVPATEAMKLMENYSLKADAQAQAAINRQVVAAQVQQGLKDIDQRFGDQYYEDMYGGKIDPTREIHKQGAIARLKAAEAEDYSKKSNSAVTQALKDLSTFQSPWEKSQEKAAARAQANAEINARFAATRADKETQEVARGWEARNKEIETDEKPISDWAARYGRLKESIDSRSPIADALAIPELLTVMAGGMGSGLRMSEAELNNIRHGRSKWQDIIAAFNQWRTDPSKALSITDSQRQQISDLLEAMGRKMRAKVNAITSARDQLADSKSVDDQHRIINRYKKQMLDLDFPEREGAPAGPTAEPDFIVVNGKVVPNSKKGK